MSIDDYYIETLMATNEKLDSVRKNEAGTIQYYVPPQTGKLLSDNWMDREKVNINEELDLFWKRNRRNYDRDFYNLINRIRVTQYEDSGFSYLDNYSEKPCRYFVLSLSMNGDSLSMWKNAQS